MNWKFWENKKARVAVPVTAAAIVVVAAGTAVAVNLAGGGITQAQAQTIALEHAGVTPSETLSMEVTRDDGVYEVDFATADRVYEYTVQGRSGQVVDFSYKTVDGQQPAQMETTPPASAQKETSSGETASQVASGTVITEDQAKSIALEHAGVAEADADATFYRVEQDRDNGRSVYEVEFYDGTTEYDYEIDQNSGEVLSYDSDIEGWAVASQGGEPVTLEQATELVVARVEGLTAQDVRIQEEYDDGRWVYEGEAWYNGTEYEFEIDASTGAFLNWSAEGR